MWGEALARHYADAHGVSMICVRIGHVTAADRPQTARDFSVWCSQRDVARMFELAVAAPPGVRFDVFFALSGNCWGYRDLEHAREVLGLRASRPGGGPPLRSGLRSVHRVLDHPADGLAPRLLGRALCSVGASAVDELLDRQPER